MKILLHICCGPCATYCVQELKNEGHEVFGYFYNPNIHPLTEYRLRKESAQKTADILEIKLIDDTDYDVQSFLRTVVFREQERCKLCYHMRMLATVKVAKRGKFDAFTTTLLISPFQKHQQIIDIGNSLALEYGVPFHYQDFRCGFKQSVELSKEYELYRQQYCGCIFSEEERYRHQKKI